MASADRGTSGRKSKKKAREPVSFARVLDEELTCIAGKRHRLEGKPGGAFSAAGREARRPRKLAETGSLPIPKLDPEASEDEQAAVDRKALSRTRRRALAMDLSGLSFSGGGIRSATFNLGILQALADLGLLRRFDYLSTVSGGGYIGSWLTALIDRENRKSTREGPAAQPGVLRVEERLRTQRDPSKEEPEDPAITFLRRYSNYLTPRVGLLSADTWAMVATYLRNLMLNLLVVIPGLAAVLLIPRLIMAAIETVETGLKENLALGVGFYAGLSITLGVIATCLIGFSFASLTLSSRDSDPAAGRGSVTMLRQGPILRWMIFPLMLASLMASRWLPWVAESPEHDGWDWVLWVGLSYMGSWLVSFLVALRSPWRVDQHFHLWFLLIAVALPTGMVCGLLLWGIAELLNSFDDWGRYALGPPMVLAWFITLGAFHTGLMGRQLFDSQREWLSRVGAWLMIFAGAWALLFGTVIYGTVLIFGLGTFWQSAIASSWLVATLSGLLAAGKAGEGGLASKLRGLVAAVAPYVFIAGLILLLALGVDRGISAIDGSAPWEQFVEKLGDLRENIAKKETASSGAGLGAEASKEYWLELYGVHGALMRHGTDHPFATLIALLGLLVVGGVLAWRIDVNEFSMHRFYRNRLVRGYLGASVPREERRDRRQPFTGFYEGDDLPLQAARSAADPGILAYQPGPLHLVNTALNLVGGEELAWQERKAASFVLSPIYSGFEVPGDEELWGEDPNVARYGYRRTSDLGAVPKPLTLGTAFAISGAAASPNMGFRSSAALSFLLTVFNVRLGSWLGNPRHRKTYMRSGPFFAMLHLFMELTGKTRGRTRYVYLSDGGHFENLGIYELVRRRCRTIVACDGGADPDLAFEDLGNAIRKCRADFGVEIDIHVDEIRNRDEKGHSEWHCAVGTIHYPAGGGKTEEGTLVYIKSSLSGDEPEDVLEYQRQHPSFPHQSTGDQFFDESQFESYRRLGHHVAMNVLSRAVESGTESRVGSREKIFRPEKMWIALAQHWTSQSGAIATAFTRHTKTLDALIERLRNTGELAFLDSQIYPEWNRLLRQGSAPEVEPPEHTLWLPKSAEEKRHGFYFCNSLIQLMENVYLDLGLDDEHSHPDNRGWMNLFKHWSWSGMFRVTWAISAATYGHRFQAFCAQRLGLELGKVGIRALPRSEDGPVSAAEIAEMASAEGERHLNFYEWEQVALYQRHGSCPVASIQQLILSVAGSSAASADGEELFVFGFGYALLDAEGRILLFRIQDHLRKMSLGRQALRQLLAGPAFTDLRGDSVICRDFQAQLADVIEGRGNAASSSRPAAGGLNSAASDAPARYRFENEFRDGEERYLTLLRSVRREIQDEEAAVELPSEVL